MPLVAIHGLARVGGGRWTRLAVVGCSWISRGGCGRSRGNQAPGSAIPFPYLEDTRSVRYIDSKLVPGGKVVVVSIVDHGRELAVTLPVTKVDTRILICITLKVIDAVVSYACR